MKVRAFAIKYDTDGMNGKDIAKLPNELTFDVDDPDFDPAEDLADMISDKTGWCVIGCQFDVLQIECEVSIKYRWWRAGGRSIFFCSQARSHLVARQGNDLPKGGDRLPRALDF